MPPRKLKAVADVRVRPPDLRDAVKDAIEAMEWLGASDEALKALAVRTATEIEEAVDRAEEYAVLRRELIDDASAYKRLQKLEAMCEVTKTVGWLGPQLQGLLRDLGGAPAARAVMKKDKPVGGRLAQLRSANKPAPGAG